MAEWTSVKEAAKLCKINAQRIRELIRGGQIQAEKKGPMWWVDLQLLLDHVAQASQLQNQRPGTKGELPSTPARSHIALQRPPHDGLDLPTAYATLIKAYLRTYSSQSKGPQK